VGGAKGREQVELLDSQFSWERAVCERKERRVSESEREMGGARGATNFVWLQGCSPVCERKDAAVFAGLQR
jgi:hypothetical protein